MIFSNIELVTFVLCPYVQRSIIVLEEKGIPHQRTDIDLADTPDWFKTLSPLGKVPLLLVDDHKPLFESAVICEFLDNITPGNLLPEDDLERAYHKAWIEFGSNILNIIGRLYSVKTKDEFGEKWQDLWRRFELVESEIQSTPYFNGKSFLLIDAVYAPIFRYFEVFDLYFDNDLFITLPKVSVWRRNVLLRDSVKKAVRENYKALLIRFLESRNSYLSSLIC